MGRILVLLAAWAVVELWVFVQVANAIGFWWALLAVIGISVVGAWITKREGVSVGRRLQERLRRGEAPDREVADAGLLLVAGLLLLFPGFITGITGLLLLLPPVRAVLRPLLRRRAGRITTITATMSGSTSSAGRGPVVDTTATDIRGELEP